MLQSVNAPGASFPGVSQGILIQGGKLLALSGHVPVDAAGDLVTGDFQTQLTAVFENIGRTLAAAGVGFEAVARFTIYVTDYEPAMLPVLRQVRSKFISAAVPPASALVAVAALYDPRVRVEIDALAVVP
jgi:2-iminobutanoate/2-iminopropanoate deaminase